MISIGLSTIKKPTQGVGLGRARDMIKKLKWGGIPVYPQVFGVNSSSYCTYFLLRLDLVLSCFRHLPISTPPQRIAYLSSLTTSLFSHPQEVSVENFQSFGHCHFFISFSCRHRDEVGERSLRGIEPQS